MATQGHQLPPRRTTPTSSNIAVGSVAQLKADLNSLFSSAGTSKDAKSEHTSSSKNGGSTPESRRTPRYLLSPALCESSCSDHTDGRLSARVHGLSLHESEDLDSTVDSYTDPVLHHEPDSDHDGDLTSDPVLGGTDINALDHKNQRIQRPTSSADSSLYTLKPSALTTQGAFSFLLRPHDAHSGLRERAKTLDTCELENALALRRKRTNVQIAPDALEGDTEDDDDQGASLARSTSEDCEYMELQPSPTLKAEDTPTSTRLPDLAPRMFRENANPFPRRRNSGWDDCDLAMMVSRTTSRTRKHVISNIDHSEPLPTADEEGPNTSSLHDAKSPDEVLPPLQSNVVQLHADDNINVVHQLLTNQAALDRVRIRRARDQTNKKRRMPTRHATAHAHAAAPRPEAAPLSTAAPTQTTPTAALPPPAATYTPPTPTDKKAPQTRLKGKKSSGASPPKCSTPPHPDVRRKGKRTGKVSKDMIGSPDTATFQHVVAGSPHRAAPATIPIQSPSPVQSAWERGDETTADNTTDDATCNYVTVDLTPAHKSADAVRQAYEDDAVVYTAIDSIATMRMGSDDSAAPPLLPKRTKSTKSLTALNLIADLEQVQHKAPGGIHMGTEPKSNSAMPSADIPPTHNDSAGAGSGAEVPSIPDASATSAQSPDGTNASGVADGGAEVPIISDANGAADDGSLAKLCVDTRVPVQMVLPSLQRIGVHSVSTLRGVTEQQLVKDAGLKVGHARKLLAGVSPSEAAVGAPVGDIACAAMGTANIVEGAQVKNVSKHEHGSNIAPPTAHVAALGAPGLSTTAAAPTDGAVLLETVSNTLMEGVVVETIKWQRSHETVSTGNLPVYTMRVLNRTATPVRVTVDIAESQNIAWVKEHDGADHVGVDPNVKTMDVPSSSVFLDVGTLRVVDSDPFAVTWQLSNRFTCVVLASHEPKPPGTHTKHPDPEGTTQREIPVASTAKGSSTSAAQTSDVHVSSKLEQPKKSGGLVSRLFGLGKKRRGQHTLANPPAGATNTGTTQPPGTHPQQARGHGHASTVGHASGDAADDTIAPLRRGAVPHAVTMLGDVSGAQSSVDGDTEQPIYRVPSVSKSNPLFRESIANP